MCSPVRSKSPGSKRIMEVTYSIRVGILWFPKNNLSDRLLLLPRATGGKLILLEDHVARVAVLLEHVIELVEYRMSR